MSKPPRNKVGATPAKLVLVGLLSIVLIAVLAPKFMGGPAPGAAATAVAEAETPSDANTEVELATETASPATAAASPFGAFASDPSWPQMPLEEITKFDPLATAAWAAPAPDIAATAEREHGEEQLNELRNAQNAIIITAGEKRIARIGEYEFQVGDTVGEFKITDITSAGVVLSKFE